MISFDRILILQKPILQVPWVFRNANFPYIKQPS